MGASMSPVLATLLPPAHQIDEVISEVVSEVKRLAHLAPSLRLSAEIIEEADERRQRFLNRVPG